MAEGKASSPIQVWQAARDGGLDKRTFEPDAHQEPSAETILAPGADSVINQPISVKLGGTSVELMETSLRSKTG